MPPPPSPSSRARLTPLPASLAFSFLNSIGTGAVTNGVFFLTKNAYGFSDARNFSLALLSGITYIVGAGAAGPAVNRLLHGRTAISPRAVLLILMLAMALLGASPWVVGALSDDPRHRELSLWLMVGVYSSLSGVLWPLVESFLSGGRSGENLRRATGIWNTVWSGAVVLTFWSLALFMPGGTTDPAHSAHRAELAMLMVSGAHVMAAVVLAWFPRVPGEHIEGEHEPHPAVYRRLLTTYRMLLPTSYILLSALTPYLPGSLNRLGVPAQWHTVLASSWLCARVGTFWLFQRWGSWHGKWWQVHLSGACLLAGFGLTVLAPTLAPGSTGAALVVVGLAVFGVGMASTYSAAIYYAMEVGKAGVDAGGTHEALIGVGYTVGPLMGLAAIGAVSAKVVPTGAFEPVMLGAAGILGLMVGCAVWARARHERRDILR